MMYFVFQMMCFVSDPIALNANSRVNVGNASCEDAHEATVQIRSNLMNWCSQNDEFFIEIDELNHRTGTFAEEISFGLLDPFGGDIFEQCVAVRGGPPPYGNEPLYQNEIPAVCFGGPGGSDNSDPACKLITPIYGEVAFNPSFFDTKFIILKPK